MSMFLIIKLIVRRVRKEKHSRAAHYRLSPSDVASSLRARRSDLDRQWLSLRAVPYDPNRCAALCIHHAVRILIHLQIRNGAHAASS